MAKRLLNALAVLVIVLNIFPTLTVSAQGADTAAELQGGICVYKCGKDVQQWIDGELTKKAAQGGEWYIMSFAQSGERYDFSAYERALLEYLSKNKVASATSREKYALTLLSIGSEDSYICDALESSAGQQGLMSLIFGLHIVNNGCTAGDITSDKLIGEILAQQLSDGGFAIIGQNGDPDCTAMTVTALAPYYKKNSKVKAACDKAIEFLSGIQQTSGAYKSFGKENCESTAQVLLALSSLGIDGDKDSRFIKNGSSLLDGLAQFALPDGSFEHAKGEGTNESAVTQAFYSLSAYMRLSKGEGAFFVFDNAKPQTKAGKPSAPIVTTKVTEGKPTSSAATKAPAKTTKKSSSTALTEGAASTSSRASVKSGKSTSRQTQGQTEKTTTKKSGEASRTSLSTSGTEGQTQSVTQNDTLTDTSGSAGGEVSGTLQTSTEPVRTESSPASQETESSPSEEEHKSGKSHIKAYIYAGVGAAVLIGCIVLIIRGKRRLKSFVFIIAVGSVLCAVTAFLDIETREEHFAPPESVADSENAGQATMSIDCLTIQGEADNIPLSGYILEAQSFDIREGETAFDLLNRAAKAEGILLDIKGSEDMIYVAGIAGIYEYDHGELSGWMYYVNGKAPSVNSSQYVLKDGDRVEWRYTREIGHDLDGEDEYYENN